MIASEERKTLVSFSCFLLCARRSAEDPISVGEGNFACLSSVHYLAVPLPTAPLRRQQGTPATADMIFDSPAATSMNTHTQSRLDSFD